ncbi:serine hydrolase domain-containing protein, partial [uncultured Bifidobacterium sp.]|uniref:serine hydrolase domain-containing protein n=1 Tax=uncultured Bifidobacterium sp. TaxID=165187 RepID=UPI0028DB0CE7
MRPSQRTDDDGPSDAALAETDRIMGSLVREGRAPSYVYAVFDRSGILHVAGGGPDAAGLDAAELQRLRFRIASMSKSFTAAAILRLTNDGLLHLDQAAADIVPEMSHVTRFRDDDPGITIADLLSMRSGLATDDAWADRQESMTPEDLQALLRRGVRTVFSPGEAYEYSNLGYAVLGRIIRTITGEEPAAYIESRIMRPLGLADTTYDFRRTPAGLLITGCHAAPAIAGEERPRTWEKETFTAPGAFSVIGGVISSLKDVAAWDRWLAAAFDDAVRSHVHDEVLPASLRRIMQTGHTPIPPVLRSGSSRG